MRILLGLVLSLSVSFACDEPYEEIGGHKIGCPIDRDQVIASSPLESGEVLNMFKADGFFDTVAATEVDNKIEAIFFSRANIKSSDLSHVTQLLNSLENKWGKLNEIEPDIYHRAVNNDVIGEITLAFPKYEGDDLILIYQSKKYLKQSQDKKNKEDAEIKDEFSKF